MKIGISLAEMFRLIHDLTSASSMDPNQGVVMTFYLELASNLASRTDDRARVINVLLLQKEIEWRGQKGFLILALWRLWSHDQQFTEPGPWEVVSIDKPNFETLLTERFNEEARALMAASVSVDSLTAESVDIRFFPNGVPRKIDFIESYRLSSDNKTCEVKFKKL